MNWRLLLGVPLSVAVHATGLALLMLVPRQAPPRAIFVDLLQELTGRPLSSSPAPRPPAGRAPALASPAPGPVAPPPPAPRAIAPPPPPAPRAVALPPAAPRVAAPPAIPTPPEPAAALAPARPPTPAVEAVAPAPRGPAAPVPREFAAGRLPPAGPGLLEAAPPRDTVGPARFPLAGPGDEPGGTNAERSPSGPPTADGGGTGGGGADADPARWPGPAALSRAGPDAGAAGPGREYAAYLDLVRRRVQESLHYPLSARRRALSGIVHVEIEIDPRGAVAGARVVGSSSHRILDDAALDAVRAVERVPFPPELAPRTLRARLPVIFDLR